MNYGTINNQSLVLHDDFFDIGNWNASLLDSIPMACFLMDSETYEIFDCNKAAADFFFQKDKNQKINMKRTGQYSSNDIFMHAKREVLNACNKSLAKGNLIFKHIHKTLCGKKIPCEITVAPIVLAGKKVYAYYIRDLEGNQRLFTEIKKREIAEEESRAKTRFLAHMSHEIRTPMNAVLGITEIELQKDNLPVHAKDAFTRIHSSSSLLLTLINDILDVSKVNSGKLELLSVPYDTINMIADTVQLNSMYMNNKPIEFRLYVDKDLPTHIIGDVQRIKQVLNNVLSNAFKYTKKGIVVFSIKAEKDKKGKTTLVIKVKDTGCGMTSEQTTLIFETEFNRFKTAGADDVEGTGLGMNIVKQLISLMDGTITVESEPGIGTVITMTIPQEVEVDTVIGEKNVKTLQSLDFSQYSSGHASKTIITGMPYGRVLVVDDVESNLFVAKGLLAPYNLEVELTDCGYDAVSRVKSGNEYDLIFMDHMMPGIDGTETTKLIRESGYTNAVIALTANVFDTQSNSIEMHGFTDLISKPIDKKQLDACLMKYIYDEEREIEYLKSGKNLHLLQSELPEKIDIDAKLIEATHRDIEKTLKLLGRDFNDPKQIDPDYMKQFVIQVHGVKSALLHINETDLSETAGVLEKAGKENDLEVIGDIVPHFIEGLKTVSKTLTPQERDYTDNDDVLLLSEQLDEIRSACESYDIKTTRNAVKVLKQNKWTRETAEMIDELSVLLSHSYFEEAAIFAGKAINGN